jgi:tripartite-type tricarboxylate transporter receptor subunit TctC
MIPAGRAETWPAKPVKVIVPFGAGGNTDIVTRIVAQPLGDALGQPFVVENRPGAAGALGADAVARAPADGYTLLMATLPQLAIVPAMSRTGYDPVKDFTPISNIGANPFVLTVGSALPVKTVKEFVDEVRRQPNKLTYVATGVGSLNHLTMALFLHRAGLDMTAVQYKGGPAGVTDLIGGHVHAYFASVSLVASHANSGNLRFLAVTSESRLPQFPDVPTLAEAGFPGFKSVLWTGLLGPSGMPKDIVERLAVEIARALKDPGVRERLAGNGVDPIGSSPAEFAAMIATDIGFWAEAVKVAGVQEK